jgi:hypothetical protein
MKPFFKKIVTITIASSVVAGFSSKVFATVVTVTDVTDWGTTPMEIVNLDLPYVTYDGNTGYSGGVYAGINTLSVTENGNTYTESGFCIDPFHISLDGPQSYNTIGLASAPKYPGPMGATTALDIEELWAEYFPSAQTSSTVAAGLQLAIWDLVANAAATANDVPVSDYYTLTSGNDYGAAADLASLNDYTGPVADLNLIGLTGPGQDYVISNPLPPLPQPSVPDSGPTLALLGSALVGLQGFRRKLGCVSQ